MTCSQEPKSGPFSEPDQSYHFLCFSLNITVYQLTWQHDTIGAWGGVVVKALRY